jgi:nicotinamide riboside transporter PnuC
VIYLEWVAVAASVLGVVLNARGLIHGFYLWMFSNSAFGLIAFSNSNWGMLLSFTFNVAMAVYGAWFWRKEGKA